jgi:hypothetical protein
MLNYGDYEFAGSDILSKNVLPVDCDGSSGRSDFAVSKSYGRELI